MKRLISFFAVTALLIAIGCAGTSSSLWSIAQSNGQNRVFSVNIGGKTQRAVWTSAVGHPEHVARHRAHQQGLRLLGSNAYDVDVKVTHRSDGQCRVDMLMALP